MFLDIQNLSYQHEKPPVLSRAQNRRKAIAKIAPEPTLHNNCKKQSIFPENRKLYFPEYVFWDGVFTAISQKILHLLSRPFLDVLFSSGYKIIKLVEQT